MARTSVSVTFVFHTHRELPSAKTLECGTIQSLRKMYRIEADNSVVTQVENSGGGVTLSKRPPTPTWSSMTGGRIHCERRLDRNIG